MKNNKISKKDELKYENIKVRKIVNTLIDRSVFDKHYPDISHKDSYLLGSMFGFYTMASGKEALINRMKSADPLNSHRLNAENFRDFEYDGPPEVIASGCSQTFGQGVPEELRWSNQLSKLLNVSVRTLAVPGWSIQCMVNAIMSHIKKYGKPKSVVLLVPDFLRFDFVSNKNVLISHRDRNHISEQSDVVKLVHGNAYLFGDRPKISKVPHIENEVISPETAAFMSGQALSFFVEYCKASNIKIVWSTWNIMTDELVSYVKNIDFTENIELLGVPPRLIDFETYVPPVFNGSGISFQLDADCHSELKKQNSNVFDLGSDSDEHMGSHIHMHFAELFAKELKDHI